jgi:hypothetical protein
MMMGMYDGIAGLQGFVVRETVSGATLGCQPFAGPSNSSVAQAFGVNVNNCVPNAPMMNGTCTGAQLPMSPWPASCVGGFRNGQGCAMNNDCEGAMTDATELAQNPMGLLYSRDEVRKNFKITLQNTGKLTWPIAIEKNPSNPAHVISWDQANRCVTNMGMPSACGTVDPQCMMQDGATNTCINVRTWVNGNELLGYESTQLANLQSMSGIYSADCTACHAQSMSGLKHPTGGLTPTTCATCHTNATGVHALVPVDVQTTCASCHGGGTSSTTNPPAAGIMWFGTSELNVYANGMHNGENTAPTASNTTYADGSYTELGGNVVSFTDNSTDNAAFPASAVQVIWGDGQITNHNAGAAISHTYASPGLYTIRHSVKDTGGLWSTARVFQVKMLGAGTVAKFNVVTTVLNSASAPVQGATVYLKKQVPGGMVQVKMGYTDASGMKTFNVKTNETYKVVVYKSSIDFNGQVKGKQSKVSSNTFILSGNQAASFQQGAAATNGPVGKEWKGTNGGAPIITP